MIFVSFVVFVPERCRGALCSGSTTSDRDGPTALDTKVTKTTKTTNCLVISDKENFAGSASFGDYVA